MPSDLTLWQLCDSAFPAGAFAHSCGLEAAWQAGEILDIDSLRRWVATLLQQTAAGSVPILSASWNVPDSLAALDALCDTFLLNHVANRASRAQGQAFLMACVKTFDLEPLRHIADTVRQLRLPGHFAPVFGAAARHLDIARLSACELFLFLAMRGAMSAAVRLGIVGPLQGQKIQHEMSASVASFVEAHTGLPPEGVTQTSPVSDLLQAMQDRLYSRLFIS